MPARFTRYPHFFTRDLDEATAALSRFRPHHTEIIGHRPFEFSFHSADLDTLTLLYSEVSTERNVITDVDERAYILSFTEQGSNEFLIGDERRFAAPGQGAVYAPDRQVRIEHRGERLEFLTVSLPAELVRNEARYLVGQPVADDFEITDVIDRNSVVGRMVDHIARELDNADGLFTVRSLASQTQERALIQALVETTPNNYQALLEGRKPSIAEAVVHAARDYMQEHAFNPITLGDVCNAVGVSKRTLEEAFRSFAECRPKAMLRQIRLHHMHHLLSFPAPGMTVIKAAVICGFSVSSLGRTAGFYRKQFNGERPSETLEKAHRRT